MRLAPAAFALSLTLLAVSSQGSTQKPDDQIDPRAVALVREADAARAAGNLTRAEDLLETSLAVDPRNREAFIALGRVAQAQALPGKAIRFYREALSLKPDDVTALAAQGDAMVQRGAVDRAKANLARIRTICKADCPPAVMLAATIARGAPVAIKTAQAGDKVPPKGQEQPTVKPQ